MADITNFKNKWLGQRVDFDHRYAYQCVDLVRQYLYECYGLGDSAGGGNAIDYWTNTPRGVLTKFDRVEGSAARNGDIVVMRGLADNPYGHIGIATGGMNDTKVEILEQNGSTGNGSGVGPDAIRTRWVDRTRIPGLLRPKEAAPAPAPAPQQTAAFSIERIGAKKIKLGKEPTFEWDLNKRDWQSFEENPIAHAGGSVITVTAIATHILGGRYYMANPDVARGFNAVDCIDYVEPVPAPTPPPAPENYATHYQYEKLEAPLKLQVRHDGLNKWDLNFDDYKNVKSVQQFKKGELFVAYGKASRTDLGREVYFMTEEDFLKAPGQAFGVNTVDLEPYLEPAPVEATAPSPAPEAPAQEAPAPISTDGEQIPVHVTPADPNKYKESFTTVAAGRYTAIEDAIVHDLALQKPDLQLTKGQNVNAAGTFSKDGVRYLRTKKSVDNDWWYGVPTDVVELEDLDEDGDVFNLDEIKLSHELEQAVKHLTLRKRFIIRFANFAGFFNALFAKFKKNK